MYVCMYVCMYDIGVDKHDSSHPATLKVAADKGVLFVKEIDYELLYPEV